MNITEKTLTTEKETLQKDFDSLVDKIKKLESDTVQLKSNLNAVHGAMQLLDKLILISKSEEKNEKI